MPCNLGTLVQLLQRVIEYVNKELPHLRDGNLIVCIGNTGCGKSTLLSSLIYGTESLHLTNIEDTDAKGRKKKRQVIEQREQLGIFDIGHSQNQSKTFLPQFINDFQSNLVYADIAGLQDTGGPLVEFTNCFLNQIIFKLVKHIKILIPITVNQITEARGQDARRHLQLVQKLINGSDPHVGDCILPIITKCKPNDEDLDLDFLKIILQD